MHSAVGGWVRNPRGAVCGQWALCSLTHRHQEFKLDWNLKSWISTRFVVHIQVWNVFHMFDIYATETVTSGSLAALWSRPCLLYTARSGLLFLPTGCFIIDIPKPLLIFLGHQSCTKGADSMHKSAGLIQCGEECEITILFSLLEATALRIVGRGHIPKRIYHLCMSICVCVSVWNILCMHSALTELQPPGSDSVIF